MTWLLGLLLACSTVDVGETPTDAVDHVAPAVSEQGPVTVNGAVSGWDGTGDVAIEACGIGVLVDEKHRFLLVTDAGCPLRVVWERTGHRAQGPWHALSPEGRDQVDVVLPMPSPDALKPLSASEQQYREDTIREAQYQLEDEVEVPPAAPPSARPDV